MKHTYTVETNPSGNWIPLFPASRDFCLGYLSYAQYCHPRNGYRILRGDGKVIHELKKDTEVSVGMIAGWPTPEQYELAASRALEQAKRIREQAAKHEEQRLNRLK